MEDTELLCPECGARVEPSTPAETVQPQEADAVQEDVAEAAPPKKGFGGKTAGLIAAGVGCVAVIVLAVLFLSRAFATPAQKFVAYQRQALMEGVVEPFAKGIDQANGRILSTDMTLTAAIEGNDQVNALLDGSYYTLDLARMAEKRGVDELSVLTELKRTVIPADQLKKLCEKYIDLVLSVVNENNVAVYKGEEVSMEILEGTAARTTS